MCSSKFVQIDVIFVKIFFGGHRRAGHQLAPGRSGKDIWELELFAIDAEENITVNDNRVTLS